MKIQITLMVIYLFKIKEKIKKSKEKIKKSKEKIKKSKEKFYFFFAFF